MPAQHKTNTVLLKIFEANKLFLKRNWSNPTEFRNIENFFKINIRLCYLTKQNSVQKMMNLYVNFTYQQKIKF